MASPFQRKFVANLSTFTDRVNFKKMLTEAVETPQYYDEHRVKVIYGLGGQGKTYLKTDFFVNEYLKNRAKTDKSLIYCDAIDFEHISATRSVETGLLHIAKDLIEKAGMPLPAFCLAFLKLKQLTSLSSNLEEQYPYLYKITPQQFKNNGIADEVLKEVIDFAVDSGLSEAASSVPLLGFFLKKLTNKGKNKVIEWLRESDAKDVLEGLDDMDKFTLLEKLPMFLGWDVYKALQASATDGIPRQRIVIVIDGYETLWSDVKTDDLNRDQWVRQTVNYMTGVLFVIFGREALRWHEIEKNEDMLTGIQQLRIDGFDDEDADDFLQQVPIIEKDVRLAIIDNAKGSNPNGKNLPLYLQLEAITYESIMNSGRKPIADDFAAGNEKTEATIVNRLFKHLDKNVSIALQALSLANYIDEEIIELLESNDGFPQASVSMKELSEYSFIITENNKLQLHGVVRDVAAEQYQLKQPLKFLKLHEALFKYFDKKVTFEGYHELDKEIEMLLDYAAFHKKIFDPEGFANWILQKADTLYGGSMRVDDILTKHLHGAVDYLEPESTMRYETYTDELKIIFGQLFYQLAIRYSIIADTSEAKRFINFSIYTFESLFPKNVLAQHKELYDTGTLSDDTRFAIDLYTTSLVKAAELNVQANLNINAGEYFQKAMRISNDFDLYFDKDVFMRYLTSIGRYSEAESYFFKKLSSCFAELEEAKQSAESININMVSLYMSIANTASDVAKVLRLQRRFEEARRYGEISLNYTLDACGPNHIYTAFAKHNLLRTLVKTDDGYDYAKKLIDDVAETYAATYSPNHIYQGYLHALYFELNKNDLSEEIMAHYVEANRILINEQDSVSKEMVDITMIASQIMRKAAVLEEDAEVAVHFENIIIDVFYKKFETLKNLYGIFSPTLHEGMHLAADFLNKQDEILMADELNRTAREFQRLMGYLTNIRVESSNTAELINDTKIKAFNLFAGVMSLPSDPSLVTIEITRLPFYKTFDLFKITYLGLDIPTVRFVLSDMQTAMVINHTNEPVYKLGESDLCLTAEHTLSYAMFFFDTTIGRHGRFHILRDYHDIPWVVDKHVPEDYKEKFASLIPKLQFISEDEESYLLLTPIIFKQFVSFSNLTIYKKTGFVRLSNQEFVEFYETEDGSIGVLDPENPPTQKIRIFSKLPAMVDPVYSAEKKEEQPDNFTGRINHIFEILKSDNIYLIPLIFSEEETEEEENDRKSFSKILKHIIEKWETDGKIDIRNLRWLVVFDYNANVDLYKNHSLNYDHKDRFLKNLRDKLDDLSAMIKEIDQYIEEAESEKRE